MTPAQAITEAMQRSGLTQQEVADRLGVSRSAVHQWCSGKKVPTWQRLSEVLAVLGYAPEVKVRKLVPGDTSGRH